MISGILIMALAIGLYGYYFFKNGRSLMDMRALYSLAWLGGIGLSCMKLSLLQKDWHIVTWLCFLVAYLCFIFSYEYGHKINPTRKISMQSKKMKDNGFQSYEKGLIVCIRVVTILSVMAFAIEVAILRYIPVFSSDPEAYSLFHISGLHYFTVSTMLILPMAIIYWGIFKPRNLRRIMELSLYGLISLAIPVLIVSRALLLMTVVVSFICYINISRKIRARYVVSGIALLIGLYVFISVSRNHGVEYLNSIYQMKNPTPIFFSQPYIYIAHNYDNFNELVVNISRHSYGIKSLAPLLAFTGLKFILNIPDFPLYTTIWELNTSTYLHDSFYDFGFVGIILLSSAAGYICRQVSIAEKNVYNPIIYIGKGLLSFILIFSFFNPWFSNPTIWFYFIAIIAMYKTTSLISRRLLCQVNRLDNSSCRRKNY